MPPTAGRSRATSRGVHRIGDQFSYSCASHCPFALVTPVALVDRHAVGRDARRASLGDPSGNSPHGHQIRALDSPCARSCLALCILLVVQECSLSPLGGCRTSDIAWSSPPLQRRQAFYRLQCTLNVLCTILLIHHLPAAATLDGAIRFHSRIKLGGCCKEAEQTWQYTQGH
jgi:hypothetical protein